MPEPSDYWPEIAERLRQLGIEARLIGALAALRYRRAPRFTADVDFLARSLDGAVAAFERDGYEVRVHREGGEPFMLHLLGHGRRIDILLAQTEYQHEALDRAGPDVIAVEDVLIHKLIAWRTRDITDIVEILATDPVLDLDYLDRWVDAWEVRDRWDEVRRA